MQNGAAKKYPEGYKQWRQHRINDDERQMTYAEITKELIVAAESGNRTRQALKKNQTPQPGATADQAEEQRVCHPALGPHHCERFAGPGNQEADGIEPRFDQPELLAVLPRQ